MFEPFDIVELKKDIKNTQDTYGEIVSLSAGSLGVIVMIYDKRVGWTGPVSYEVEFCDNTGNTIALLNLGPKNLKLNRAAKTMHKAG